MSQRIAPFIKNSKPVVSDTFKPIIGRSGEADKVAETYMRIGNKDARDVTQRLLDYFAEKFPDPTRGAGLTAK